jgi:hypothetical protein
MSAYNYTITVGNYKVAFDNYASQQSMNIRNVKSSASMYFRFYINYLEQPTVALSSSISYGMKEKNTHYWSSPSLLGNFVQDQNQFNLCQDSILQFNFQQFVGDFLKSE